MYRFVPSFLYLWVPLVLWCCGCRRFGRSCFGAGGGRTGDPCGLRRCSKDMPSYPAALAAHPIGKTVETNDGIRFIRWMIANVANDRQRIGRGKDDRIIKNVLRELQVAFAGAVLRVLCDSFSRFTKQNFPTFLCVYGGMVGETQRFDSAQTHSRAVDGFEIQTFKI